MSKFNSKNSWLALALVGLSGLSGLVAAQSIFTCTDAKGRNIKSDRPIAECTDRVQQELNATGTVKRVIGPSLTGQERAALEEKEKLAAEARARRAEEKRRDRALLLRYPSRLAHDKERAEALRQIDEIIRVAQQRSVELAGQRQAIDTDLEFYKTRPGKVPGALKRRLDENEASIGTQQRFLTGQAREKQRVNDRFEEERARLNLLWSRNGVSPERVGAASAP